MHRDHTATMRDIMMRMHSIHCSAQIYALFDQGKRVSSVVHSKHALYSSSNETMHRDHTATMRDIMMRMHSIHRSAHI